MDVHPPVVELQAGPIAARKPVTQFHSNPQSPSFDLRSLRLLTPFVLIFLVQLSKHEMWRDELNAWGIALSSSTLNSLFAKLHYEGHPAFWYLLLWLISRFTPDPIAMKALEAIIGTSTYLLIGCFSPFSRLEKFFLFLGYFVSFEYTVLSRTYSICFLMLLAYLYRRSKYPDRLYSNTILLGLIANCDVIGFILSVGLFGEYVWNRVDESKRCGSAFNRQLLPICFIYCFSLALAVGSLWLAPDISWRTTGHIFESRWRLDLFFAAVLNYMVVTWLPISREFPHHFWAVSSEQHPILYTASLPLVVAGLFFLFRRAPRLLAVLGLAAIGSIAFGSLIYMGSARNFGIMFMAFVAALWIQEATGPRLSAVKYAFLGASAVAGLLVGIGQWEHSFSNSGATARWLRLNHLENAALVGTPDTSVAAVAEQLNRPIYFLDCSCSDTFLLFAARRDHFSAAQIPERLVHAASRIPATGMVLILIRPLSSAEIEALARRSLFPILLAHFTGSEVPDEDFFLYRFRASS